MLKKRLMALLVIAGIPTFATANDLTLVNNTNHDSTSVINNGTCSTILGESGVTKAHSTNVIPGSKISLACILNRSNCKADVYMTNNCSGPVIATVILDTKTGIKNVAVHDTRYNIQWSAFQATMNGGPDTDK